MRIGRWTGIALAALAVAVLPGALQLATTGSTLDRAHPVAPGPADGAPATTSAPTVPPVTEAPVVEEAVATTVTAPPPPAPPASTAPPAPSGAVPITPPEGELTGAMAPVVATAAPFEAARAGQEGEVFALVVGIDDYPGTEFDLRAAVADANTVDAALAGFGVPAANRVVLRDGQARRSQLVAAIQALVAKAGPGTTVVFAYAGHVRKLDQDTEAIIAADGNLLTDQELANLLAPSQAERMWLLLATCYAGGFTEALAPGRILTGAADANSLSYESPAIRGSYLVHHMVKEGWLDARAGTSVQEAYAYATSRIGDLYPERRPMQIDRSGGALRFNGGTPQAPTTTQPPPPTTAPEKTCVLVVVCRRS